MIRTLCALSVLLLSTPALAADSTAAKPAAKGKAAASKEEPKPASSLKAGVAEKIATKKAAAATAAATAALRASVQRARNVYKFAVEACERPERCDAPLRDDAEQRYLDACRDCATMERCSADRDAIKDGSAAGGPFNVCEGGK